MHGITQPLLRSDTFDLRRQQAGNRATLQTGEGTTRKG
jgi:hypothetical protein